MNTNGLARQYDKLTPRERLPLILAASARGDEQERDRLGASAPRVSWRVADYFGLGLAHLEISHLHFMELLDHAALYLHAMSTADTWNAEAYFLRSDRKHAERMRDVALMFGFVLKVKLAGWRLFCREQNLDPELCWSCLPGFRTLKRAEEQVERGAFKPEGAAAFLADAEGDIDKVAGEVITPESVAAELQHCFDVRADWWG